MGRDRIIEEIIYLRGMHRRIYVREIRYHLSSPGIELVQGQQLIRMILIIPINSV